MATGSHKKLDILTKYNIFLLVDTLIFSLIRSFNKRLVEKTLLYDYYVTQSLKFWHADFEVLCFSPFNPTSSSSCSSADPCFLSNVITDL